MIEFDNRGGEYSKITISYNESHSVKWSGKIAADFNINATLPLINKAVSGTVGVEGSKESDTSKAIGASAELTVKTGKRGYVPVYAPGISTGGGIKYK